jgi:hypothetical protein
MGITSIYIALRRLAFLGLLLLLLGSAGPSALGQSSQIESPSPVSSALVMGEIGARDLGDARLTRHFYNFTGTPGDLVVTIESRNLNGDVDIFTAGSLRPLAKFSLLAGGAFGSASKTIFLRERGSLILRVEARSADDNAGIYRISFSGSFEPVSAPIASEEPSEQPAPVAKTSGNTRRVNSVGARIEEPRAEVPVEERAAPPSSSEDRETARRVAESSPKSTESEATSRPSAEPARPPARRANRRRRPSAPSRSARPTPPPESTRSDTEESARSEEPKQDLPIPASARLIIEMKDGTRIERPMSTVRRVTIDSGRVVVIGNNGKVERLPMTNILRMAIEP